MKNDETTGGRTYAKVTPSEYGFATVQTEPDAPTERERPPVDDDLVDLEQLASLLGDATLEEAGRHGLPPTRYQRIHNHHDILFFRSRAEVTRWRDEVFTFAQKLQRRPSLLERLVR